MTFQTFITFFTCNDPNHFTILAGYEWGVSFDNVGTPAYSGPTGPIDMSVDQFTSTIDTALQSSGFGTGWSFTVNGYGEDVVCPEPTSMALMAVGVIVLVRRRRAA